MLCCGGNYSTTRQDVVVSNSVATVRPVAISEKNSVTLPGQEFEPEKVAIEMINQEDLDQDAYQTPMASQVRRKLIRQKLGEADLVPCQKFEQITHHTIPSNEKIIYAGFLYDQNPAFVLVITVNEEENCSYLSLGKISSGRDSKIEDSEQAMKKKLVRKLEDNPHIHKVLKRNEGQVNMSLNLTPSTIKIL